MIWVGRRNFSKRGLKRILGQTRRAIQDYEMIREGDRSLSAFRGKDSLTLLIALRKLMDSILSASKSGGHAFHGDR